MATQDRSQKMATATGGEENSVLVGPFDHRGQKWIGLQFRYNKYLIAKIKSVPEVRYSGTKTCWYLPYDKVSWKSFRALGIPYTIVDSFDNTASTFIISDKSDKVDSDDSHNSVHPCEGKISASQAPAQQCTGDADIGMRKNPDDLTITWSQKLFLAHRIN